MTDPVDAVLAKATQWREETAMLRAVLLDCGLSEALKWGKPCYACAGGNVAIIQGFKEFCALMFFKGALLKDPARMLVAPGKNSQAARQLRFRGMGDITGQEATLRAYIREAIAVERAGLKVDFQKPGEFPIPEEFQTMLDSRPSLHAAFRALTPGRQRAYLLHISSARQAKTRVARAEKWIPQILAGKGMND